MVEADAYGNRAPFWANYVKASFFQKKALSGKGDAAKTPSPQWTAGVAQLVEHVIRNDGVGSSNLFSGTIEVISSKNK